MYFLYHFLARREFAPYTLVIFKILRKRQPGFDSVWITAFIEKPGRLIGFFMYLDSTQIQRILPQSYPFILIDRVVHFRKGESLTAIKNITGTEWVFQDWCYPRSSSKLFPETLLIEAAAQAAILFYRLNNVADVNAASLEIMYNVVKQGDPS